MNSNHTEYWLHQLLAEQHVVDSLSRLFKACFRERGVHICRLEMALAEHESRVRALKHRVDEWAHTHTEQKEVA
jgi:hypothetical protein